MRLRFTTLLIVLNLIAFGLIWILDTRHEDADTHMGGLAGRIGRAVIEANRIELDGQGLPEARVLERRGSEWTLAKPLQWPANSFAVNRMLNQLQFIEAEASFTIEEIERTGQGLADYGLETPLIKLTIGSSENPTQLYIGKPTDIGNNVYLLGPDQAEIFVVSRQVIDSLLVELSDLRSRSVFNIPVFEVEALSLQTYNGSAPQNGELKVRLARTSTGWLFEAPLNAEADPALVATTINTLTAAKVARFPEGDDAVVQGLENPSMRITLQGNKRQQTLLLGNQDPAARTEATYFAKLADNPTVFTLPAQPFDALREAQAALRERNFISFDPASLNGIDISQGELQIRIQKLETGDWQVIRSDSGTAIQPYQADPTILRTLMQDLRNLRAINFASDAPNSSDLDQLGFNAPRRTITLTSPTESLTVQLAHPETNNTQLYARTSELEYIYEVDRRATLELLSLNALKYRDRRLETLPEAAQITALKLENLETGQVIFEAALSDDRSTWDSELMDQEPSRRESILALLEAMRAFNVKNYLLDEFLPAYPLEPSKTIPWAYRLTADLLLPGDALGQQDSRSYVFTKRLSGTIQVGGSEQHETIFEVTPTILDALYHFNESMQLPPEATGTPVPTPAAIEKLPAAQPMDPSGLTPNS